MVYFSIFVHLLNSRPAWIRYFSHNNNQFTFTTVIRGNCISVFWVIRNGRFRFKFSNVGNLRVLNVREWDDAAREYCGIDESVQSIKCIHQTDTYLESLWVINARITTSLLGRELDQFPFFLCHRRRELLFTWREPNSREVRTFSAKKKTKIIETDDDISLAYYTHVEFRLRYECDIVRGVLSEWVSGDWQRQLPSIQGKW